jgi:hypothetical protein
MRSAALESVACDAYGKAGIWGARRSSAFAGGLHLGCSPNAINTETACPDLHANRTSCGHRATAAFGPITDSSPQIDRTFTVPAAAA